MSSKNSILDLNQLKTVDTLYKREQELLISILAKLFLAKRIH